MCLNLLETLRVINALEFLGSSNKVVVDTAAIKAIGSAAISFGDAVSAEQLLL